MKSKKAFVFSGITFLIIIILLVLSSRTSLNSEIDFGSKVQEYERFELLQLEQSVMTTLFHSSDVSLHNALIGIVSYSYWTGNRFIVQNESGYYLRSLTKDDFEYSTCQMFFYGGYNLSNTSKRCYESGLNSSWSYSNISSNWFMLSPHFAEYNYSMYNLLNSSYQSLLNENISNLTYSGFSINQPSGKYDSLQFLIDFQYSREIPPYFFKSFTFSIDKSISHMLVPSYPVGSDLPIKIKEFSLERVHNLTGAPSLLERFTYTNISNTSGSCFTGSDACGFCFESECADLCASQCPSSSFFNFTSSVCTCS